MDTLDISVPVVVIGAGACGLTAAIAAARAGREVLVLEKDPTPAGSTAMSLGMICAAGSALQEKAGVADSAEALVEDILAATQGRTDPALAQFLAEASGPTIDWLTQEIGLDLHLETNWPGYGHRALRCHGTPNNSGEELMAMLLDAAREAGADIVTSAGVTDLVSDESGRVVGVRFETPEGATSVGCEAVILASGGYGANKAMVAEHIPDMAEAEYHGCENHQGEAVRWGQGLGAAIDDMGAFQGIGTLTSYGFGVPHYLMMEGGICVNERGERFMDELDNISSQCKVIAGQPGHAAYVIYDQAIHERTKAIFGEYRDNAALIEGGARGETLAEACEKARIDSEAVARTLAGLPRGGRCEFGREFPADHGLEGPFFALKVRGALYHTQGGLCIDRQARVVREDGSPLPNLFAGGGAVRSVSGPAEWGYLPAIGLATAVVFGRVAGEAAAQLATRVSA